MTFRIKIAGIGGQGVQFLGKLLCAAAFRANLNVSQGTIYEPSTSGGLTVADIIIAPDDEEIAYPFIEENPDIFLALAQRGLDEYTSSIGVDTIIVADESYVHNFDIKTKHRAARLVPFAKTAFKLGSEKAMNLVALGYLSELLKIDSGNLSDEICDCHPDHAMDTTLLEVTPELFEDSLIDITPKKFQEINLSAFKEGYKLAENMHKLH